MTRSIAALATLVAGIGLAAVLWLRRLPFVKVLRMTRKALPVPWKARRVVRR